MSMLSSQKPQSKETSARKDAMRFLQTQIKGESSIKICFCLKLLLIWTIEYAKLMNLQTTLLTYTPRDSKI